MAKDQAQVIRFTPINKTTELPFWTQFLALLSSFFPIASTIPDKSSACLLEAGILEGLTPIRHGLDDSSEANRVPANF
jgi:hypothetical protein